METRTLGKTGIQVSVQCLGAMMFGLWGNRDQDESVRIIHHALDHGTDRTGQGRGGHRHGQCFIIVQCLGQPSSRGVRAGAAPGSVESRSSTRPSR